MDALRRILVTGGAGALLGIAWPALGAASPGAPLFAFVDIDTIGARGAYAKFAAAVARRFATAKIQPEVRFVAAVAPMDDAGAGRLREGLVALGPRLIVCANPGFAIVARKFDLGIPILFFSPDDPVAAGLTDSLVRPATGMTGFTLGPSSTFKRQEMLLRLVPHCRVMGQIVDAQAVDEGLQRPSAESTNPWKQVERRRFSCETPAELAAILRRADARTVDAWDVAYVTVPFRFADETVQQFNALNRPVMYPRLRHVRLGGMAAFEPSVDEAWDVWASQADSLLRGVPIVDIPVVQSTRYGFGLNLKVCRRAGIEPPKALLKIADLVME
ncbi:MAG: ABC transporter substrate binding protein [Betaproteobacteria bacterium]